MGKGLMPGPCLHANELIDLVYLNTIIGLLHRSVSPEFWLGFGIFLSGSRDAFKSQDVRNPGNSEAGKFCLSLLTPGWDCPFVVDLVGRIHRLHTVYSSHPCLHPFHMSPFVCMGVELVLMAKVYTPTGAMMMGYIRLGMMTSCWDSKGRYRVGLDCWGWRSGSSLQSECAARRFQFTSSSIGIYFLLFGVTYLYMCFRSAIPLSINLQLWLHLDCDKSWIF